MSAPVHPYDLAATLAAARAVTFAAMDGLPSYQNAPGLEPAINHLGHLITGLQLLLDQAIVQADALQNS